MEELHEMNASTRHGSVVAIITLEPSVANANLTLTAMPGSLSLGRVAGIPLALHYSWFLIAGLISLSMAARFAAAHPDWARGTVWGTAIVTALLFFASLLIHELAHAMMGRAHGVPTRSITLFALGGVAQMERESPSAKVEFLIAVVGPLTSLAIGGLCLAAAAAIGWSLDEGAAGVAGSIAGWLGSINVMLALFNLIPGYPLDGGRVLRALLWWRSHDQVKATRQASLAGQAVAFLFIAFGIVQAFGGAGFGGLWLALIGFFLLTASQQSYMQVAVINLLSGVRVGDVMTDECETVDASTPLRAVVDDKMLRSGRRCVMVSRGHSVVGLVTPQELSSIERHRWDDVTAGDVMRRLDQLRTITPDASAADALSEMVRQDVNQLPVVTNGRLDGVVSRAHLLRLIQTRAELGARA
jgi:Zn-dependent protease/predicted transcriptional regulator